MRQRPVDVGGDRALVRRCRRHGRRRYVEPRCGRLGRHVDVAGGGAATDVRPGRPHEHLDLLEVEDVAGDQAVVADAVDEQAVGGVEAAHVEHVAGGVRRAAALAGLERDAGHVAQRSLSVNGALLFDHRARDDGHRLGDVAQRHEVLGRGHRRRCCRARPRRSATPPMSSVTPCPENVPRTEVPCSSAAKACLAASCCPRLPATRSVPGRGWRRPPRGQWRA